MTQSNGKTVLVTGGAGYIASHCVVTLQEAGYDVIALDNFTNSVNGEMGESLALKRVEKISGKPVTFYKVDLLDTPYLNKIFQNVRNLNEINLAQTMNISFFFYSTKSIQLFILRQ